MKTKEEITLMCWDKLEPHPNNPRSEFPAEQVQEMSRSIAAQGILQPLVCVPLKDGQARIVLGHMRWRGAKALGEQAPLLPVRLVDWDEKRQALAMITENMTRYDLNPVDEGRYLAMLKDTTGMTIKEIAEATGLRKFTVRTRLILLQLPAEVQEIFATGELPPTSARYFYRITDEVAMIALAQKCARDGATQLDIAAALKTLPPKLRRTKNRSRRKSRRPKIAVTVDILENCEGAIEIKELTRCLQTVCQQCKESGEICQQCPLSELVQLIMFQPNVRERPEQGEYIEDWDEWRGLSPGGLKVTKGHAPGWHEVI